MRIFPFQSVGQVDSPVPVGQVLLVQLLCREQLNTQRLDQAVGQDGHPVFSRLGTSHQNLALAKIHILDPQRHAFHQTQTTAIEKLYNQTMNASELGDHLPDFFFGQDRGHVFGSFGPHQFEGQIQILAQYLAVWEQQRSEGLVLCRSSRVFLYGQVGEKLADFLLTHFQRMLFVVIENKALGPVDVGLLGAVGIVLEPNCIAHLVEQLLGSLCHYKSPEI
jgi:hypothetical protein